MEKIKQNVIVKAKSLWEEFCNIPMNLKKEYIEKVWCRFPVGTYREKIWHWLKTFDVSVTKDWMGL